MCQHKHELSIHRPIATTAESTIETDLTSYRASRPNSACWAPKTGRRSVSCEIDMDREPVAMSENSRLFYRDERYQHHQHPSQPSMPSIQAKRSASHTSLRSETSLAMKFPSRSNQPFQLLSFDSLGLTNRSPGFMASRRSNDGTFHPPVMDGSSSLSSPLSSSTLHMKPDHPYGSPLPLTPPETEDNLLWNPNSHLPLHELSSHHHTSSSSVITSNPFMEELSTKESSDSDSVPEQGQQAASLPVQSARGTTGSMATDNGNTYPDDDPDGWLQEAIMPVVSALPMPKAAGNAVQLVSQTLPCPPSETSVSALPRSAFTPIVKAIQNRLEPGSSPYISIVHAVPPRFNLSCLPTSPPSTPQVRFSGGDYFSNTVFSSAAAVPAYPCTNPSSFPLSGGKHVSTPIVPPYSVNVAVVERYIPPTSSHEYRALFSDNGPSLLLDRLHELSTCGGSLVLIYPTKKGAEIFRDKYLSPILDPVLRQLAVINGLSTDIGNALGCMASIPFMDNFQGMKSRLLALCESISAKSQASTTGPKTNFTLAYSGAAMVPIDRKLWTDWYIEQESPRAREILKNYWRKGQRLPDNNMVNTAQRTPSSQEITGAALLREIVEGVRNRPYPEDGEPDCGVELGVFVIRRSL